MLIMLCKTLIRRWPGGQAPGASVITHARGVCVASYRLSVGIMDIGPVDIIDRRVVHECAVVPAPALVANAAITKAIVDSAVKSNVLSPIARVPHITPIAPSPIARGPQRAHERYQNPHPWNPIVSVRTIRPVAWGPYITRPGHNRLRVHGQQRWR